MAPADISGQTALSGLRILIAENMYEIAQSLRRTVETAGATVVGIVPTVAGALDYVRSGTVNVALVDMNLRDGFADDLIQALVEQRIAFIIVTAYQALPMNADEHAVAVIRKPVCEAELIGHLIDVAGTI